MGIQDHLALHQERCVLLSPHEAHLLQEKKEGVILITKATDPAWTPLFLLVDAVVVESGGTLSHSAIVAREFGIPCVLSVNNLLDHIETGDFVRVNGSSGKIDLLKKQE